MATASRANGSASLVSPWSSRFVASQPGRVPGLTISRLRKSSVFRVDSRRLVQEIDPPRSSFRPDDRPGERTRAPTLSLRVPLPRTLQHAPRAGRWIRRTGPPCRSTSPNDAWCQESRLPSDRKSHAVSQAPAPGAAHSHPTDRPKGRVRRAGSSTRVFGVIGAEAGLPILDDRRRRSMASENRPDRAYAPARLCMLATVSAWSGPRWVRRSSSARTRCGWRALAGRSLW